jgi:hypothetical protein
MFLISAPAIALQIERVGHVFDVQGRPVAGAKVLINNDRTYSCKALYKARPRSAMLQASEFRMHVVVLLFSLGGFGLSSSSATELSGELTDPQGHVVPDASVRETHTDPSGHSLSLI